MNKLLKILTTVLVAVGVVGCGGGGGSAGTSPFGGSGGAGGTTSSAASIDVIASSVQVQSAGDQVTISAIVKDSGNVSLPKAPVTFSTDTGTLTSAATVTDAAGVATAVLSAGTNRSNRPLTVIVRSGNAVGSLVLPVTGTVLSYTGPTTVTLGKSAPISVKALDSKGVPIVGLPVSFASSLNNGLSATSANTDVQGTATVDYTATNAGTDSLTITGGGASVTPMPTIQISAADFLFVDSTGAAITQPVSISVGATSAPLFVRYLVNGVAQAGRTVSFTATAGTVVSSTPTNAGGIASVTLTSTTASPATLQATVGSGVSTVQTSVPILFVATVPFKLTLQVSPTAIGPNVGTSTLQQARVVATVVDANGNPVTGATVNFSRVVDPSGGNLSQPSAITDASGQASVQFIAGASTTASNGVQLRGQVSGTAISGTTNLSVNQSALFIALGTGNTITNIDDQTYRKDWVVYVTDSNGIAVPNITLTIKVLPLLYGKGFLVFDTVAGSWLRSAGSIDCVNEDDGGTPFNLANAYNGVLDPGEDRNGDGRLQPGNVISVTAAGGTTGTSTGTFTTDGTGRATISLIYAESYVPWVKVRLSASAVVTGTESSTQSDFYVTGAASDFTSKTVAPAGVVSPFGTVADCSNPN
ncbi:MAG: Ig-like domain-containing protein [Caldimonas sp.]